MPQCYCTCEVSDAVNENHGISYYRFVVWSNNLNLFHSAKLGTLGSCNLLLSDVQQGDTPRSLFIYKRWINSIYTIRGKSCSRHYSCSFSSYFYCAIPCVATHHLESFDHWDGRTVYTNILRIKGMLGHDINYQLKIPRWTCQTTCQIVVTKLQIYYWKCQVTFSFIS